MESLFVTWQNVFESYLNSGLCILKTQQSFGLMEATRVLLTLEKINTPERNNYLRLHSE